IISITPEIGIEEIPIYAGGLGILEGDKFLLAAKKGLSYVVLTLFYPKGYVDYLIEDNKVSILEREEYSSLIGKLEKEGEFKLNISNSTYVVKPLSYKINNSKIVYFLVEPNFIDKLYIERNKFEYEYKYVILAKSSFEYIKRNIGFENVAEIHAQESMAGLIFLLVKNVRKILFIHTPGPWGHPIFSAGTIRGEFGINIDSDNVMLTRLIIEHSDKVVAVSRKHEKVTLKTFPETLQKLTHVTNGVNIDRWMHDEIKKLLILPEVDVRNFMKAHNVIKSQLLEFLGKKNNKKIIINYKDIFFITWARRITTYKRPFFIARLIEEISGLDLPVFFILGGKAHPNDYEGIEYMKLFSKLEKEYKNVVYYPDYDIIKAKIFLSGSDLLLFTPFSGWEACGTSYMKAGINGVPTLASRDGGALEIIRDGYNGWFFGRELNEVISLNSDEAKRINNEDYEDFKKRFLAIVSMYQNDKEKYYEVMLNTLKSFVEWAGVERVFRELNIVSE
ncbi:MAG: glycogen/starch/alpha-glucan phosphorylase, partial [Sulfolobales archaeon]